MGEFSCRHTFKHSRRRPENQAVGATTCPEIVGGGVLDVSGKSPLFLWEWDEGGGMRMRQSYRHPTAVTQALFQRERGPMQRTSRTGSYSRPTTPRKLFSGRWIGYANRRRRRHGGPAR